MGVTETLALVSGSAASWPVNANRARTSCPPERVAPNTVERFFRRDLSGLCPLADRDVRAAVMEDYSPPPAGNGYFFSVWPTPFSGAGNDGESLIASFSTTRSAPRPVGANLRTTLVTGAVNLPATTAKRRQRAVELKSSSRE